MVVDQPPLPRPVNVAYITLRYPPMVSSGTRRVESVLRFLPVHGFTVHSLTISEDWVRRLGESSEFETGSPLRPVAPHDRVMRWMSRTKPLSWIQREILIPDILAPWARYAARYANRALPEIDLVYATGPPFSALVAGYRLSQRRHVPLVLEVRDPPSFNRWVRRRSRLTQERMFRFERKFLASADRIIVVTEGTRSRLLALHPQLDPARVAVVTNGRPEFDPDPSLSGRDPSRFTVTYVGSYQGDTDNSNGSWFTPSMVLPALSALGVPAELRVVGPVTKAQHSRLASPSPSVTVTCTGFVDRHLAIAEVAAADVNLIMADDEHPWWIGRKVFEAMAYAQRILAVVPEGDTSALLTKTPKAWTIPPGSRDLVSRTVNEIFDQWSRGELPPSEYQPFVQTDRSSVEEIAAVLHAALSDKK